MEKVEEPRLQNLLEQRLQQGERLLKDVEKSIKKLGGDGKNQQNAAARRILEEAERLPASGRLLVYRRRADTG